jgi:UDP-N-acetylmuramoylalanine--D-glutamate ligase
VTVAWQRAEPGDVVLLAPACASFDQFKSFTDRGDHFRAAVQNLDPNSASHSSTHHRES